MLAGVFVHHGGYHSPQAFINGFTPAMWVAVGLSTIGIMAAGLTGGRRHASVADSPVVAAEPQAAAA